jgi:hypothetical protein
MTFDTPAVCARTRTLPGAGSGNIEERKKTGRMGKRSS